MALHNQTKTTLLLLVVCLVLAGIFGMSWWKKEANQKQSAATEDLVVMDRAAVNGVEITKASGSTTLEKKDSTWVITSDNNAEADPVAVEQLIATIDNAAIEVVSSQRANETAAQFALDEANRVRVVLKAGETVVVDLFVGKLGTLSETFYVQKADQQTVYLVSGSRFSIDRADFKKKETTDANTNSQSL